MRPLRSLLAAFLALALLAPAAAHAEKAKLHLERVDVSKYPRVKAYLTMIEPDGHIVTGKTEEGCKLIVVFSDGIDVGGMDKRGFADLGKRAVAQNIVIDTVGYAPFEPGKLKSLFEMSKQTNGTERIVKTPQEVSSTFANIAE